MPTPIQIATELAIPDGPLLAILAHPDDELLFAGKAAATKYARQRVRFASLTMGEAGLAGPETNSRALGHIRSAELRYASRILGADPPVIFDFPDGSLTPDHTRKYADALSEVVDHEQPARMLRLPPNGLTLHPDHIEASRAALIAFNEAAPPGCELWEPVATSGWRELDLDEFMYSGELEVPGHDELVVSWTVGEPFLEQKMDAYRAHASQGESLRHLHPVAGIEAYRLVARKS